jgi:hypothetical protein
MKKLTLLLIGATMMAACGGSSAETSETTVAVVESTVAVSPVAETTVAATAETTAAAAETSPAETVPADSAVTTVGAAEAASALAAGAAGSDPMAQLATTLGISDPADMKCIQDKIAASSTGGTPDATGIDPAMIKAVLACQPPTLVDLATQQLQARIPTATTEQARCAAKATLTELAQSDSVDFSALTAGPSAIPADLRAKLDKPVRDCGLSEADVKAYLG